VLNHGRHLPVVADHDDRRVGSQWQRGHHRLRQVHLAGLVQHEQVAQLAAEDLFRPLLLQQRVRAAGRHPEHGVTFAQDHVRVPVFPGLFFGVLAEGDDTGRRVVLAGDAVQRHVQQPLVEVLGEQGRLRGGQLPQLHSHRQHVGEQHVGGGVRLARHERPTGVAGGHRPLQPGEHGEGGAVTLAGAGRPLHQQDRRRRVFADERPLARLEVVQ